MGAFNILHVTIRCSNCSNEFAGRLQFKVGETWQHEYRVGDRIKVGHDQEIAGNKIVAYGILEKEICPSCANRNKEEYNIYINDCVITGIDDSPDLTLFVNANEGRYYFNGGR